MNHIVPARAAGSGLQGQKRMARQRHENDPLYTYEQEPVPCDKDRRNRLMELKQAIQAGTYDDQEFLNNLINNLKGAMPDHDQADD